MEKRWYRRSPDRVRVRYSRGARTRTVFTQDVSRTGLYIETDQVYERGTLIRIEVESTERRLSFHGRVMWAGKVPLRSSHGLDHGMGIRCIDAGEGWLRFIRDRQVECLAVAPTPVG